MSDISTDIVDGAEFVTEVAPTQKRKPGRPAGSKSTPKASKLTFKTFDGDSTGLFFQVTEDVGVFYNGDKTPLVALSCASPYPVALLAEAVKVAEAWPALTDLDAAEKLAKALGLTPADKLKVYQYAIK